MLSISSLYNLQRCIVNILSGYNNGVCQADKKRYHILDDHTLFDLKYNGF